MINEHLDETYRTSIRNYLIHRAHAVRVDAKLNLLNLAGLSEDFYAEFLNTLLGLQLENANASERNKSGIDLIDWENHVAAQVSATCAPDTIRKKIRNSIKKFKIPESVPWQFYFVPITDQAPELKSGFVLPDGLTFDESKDVLDITRIMELAKGIDRLHDLSELVRKFSTGEDLRKSLDDLLLLTWKAHRSYKLMQTDEIDVRLFPGIKETNQKEIIPIEALGRKKGDTAESPVWSIIRESWNEPKNRPVMIQGEGGIGKTVTLFSLTGMDKDRIHAPAVYVPMFELVDQQGEIVNLTDYFQSADFFPSLSEAQRDGLCTLATRPWAGPSLLLLLDGFNEVPSKQRWNMLSMLRKWYQTNPGAQIIVVSRPMDNLSLDTAFGKEETISVTLSPLSPEAVAAYLRSPQGRGAHLPESGSPVWESIVYPLFLNLYIKTDKLQDQPIWKDYPLNVRDAAGTGSLIWNYLQRELLRQEDDRWILRCAVACEYLAPILAHNMIQRYDYTIDLKDALAVLQTAVSELDLERMPAHLAELFSRWETQELSTEPPAFLKELNWPEILLRESGLLVPCRETQGKRAGKKLEQRFEFLHQSFRDCLAGLYLINQAEMAGADEFSEVWGNSQNQLAMNYAAELMTSEVYGALWETNRKAQASGDEGRKNHTAISKNRVPRVSAKPPLRPAIEKL